MGFNFKSPFTISQFQTKFIEGTESLMSLFDPIPADGMVPPVTEIPSEEVCAIAFSSGTTGLPKAVEITHKSFLGQALLGE